VHIARTVLACGWCQLGLCTHNRCTPGQSGHDGKMARWHDGMIAGHQVSLGMSTHSCGPTHVLAGALQLHLAHPLAARLDCAQGHMESKDLSDARRARHPFASARGLLA